MSKIVEQLRKHLIAIKNKHLQMKILFLDFDGVVSTFEKGWRLDDEKLSLLKEIIDETNAKIVVSSSWKVGYDDVDKFIETLGGRRKSETIKNNGNMFQWFCNNIYDITDSNGPWRGDEIQRWIVYHQDEIETYVILDDDSDMRENQLFNFVQTDSYEGITSREVKLCTKILNHERIQNPIRLNLELTTKWRNNCKGLNNNILSLLKEYYNKFA